MIAGQRTFRLQIVDLEGVIFEGPVRFVVIPGVLGELGVLAGHAPLLTPINGGEMRYVQQDGQETRLFLEGGIAEVQPDLCTILADHGMRIPDIDPMRAQQKIQTLEQELAAKRQSTMDFLAAETELRRELARLQAFQRYKQSAPRVGQEYQWERPSPPAVPKIHPEALED
ncbi:MAG: ATP synthase F1 subunit epsilon [Acidithiobacillus sp.]|nr:ATP synthase F1 subunit epsilon [Acidithiobacillus sp.]